MRRSTITSTFDNPDKHFLMALHSSWYRTIIRLNAELVNATSNFYQQRGLLPALMPVTVNSVSSPMGLGSDSLPVRIELMGEPTYLADSMQFQLEFMLRHADAGAYYIMPTFRGEDPDATHLNQFFHSEAEIPGGIDDVMRLVEDYVRRLCRRLLDGGHEADIAEYAGTTTHLTDMAGRRSFPQVTLAEARTIVSADAVAEPLPGVFVLTRAGERQLIDHFGGVVWLTRPSALAVPFYQAADPDGTARSADLLFGTGEVVGCGERHTSAEDTLAALLAHQVKPEQYEWYLDMKRHAPMRTAGFGLGLERFLMWVLCHDDIRDLHVMPRLKGVPTWM